MVSIKKTFVFSIAALSIAAQAHAGAGARDVRQDTRDRDRDRTTETRNGVPADSAGARNAGARARALSESAAVSRLSPSQKEAFNAVMSENPNLARYAGEAIRSTDARLTALNAAQIEGLANLRGIQRDVTQNAFAALNPAAKAEQAYFTLVTDVAREARSWSGSSFEVSSSLLIKANARIAAGESRGDALLHAKSEVEAEINSRRAANAPEWHLNIDDIFKNCKRA